IPDSKGVKCGLIRSNPPLAWDNHRPAQRKIPKSLVYAQASPLGSPFVLNYTIIPSPIGCLHDAYAILL
ncbi:MAG: hypothetical protein O2909_12400, partial [Chloroflexi bacterium]|nr:hypothetical protein [Chloroflexota bacterium]